MTETVRRLKINKIYEGQACRWCNEALAIGDDGAICGSCNSPHHARCWDQQNGCNGDPACVNRPLQQLQGVTPKARKPSRPLQPGESFCPTCGDIVTGVCFRCQHAVPDAEFTGEKKTAPEAKEALRLAIIGMFCFGVVLGPIAIVKGANAKRTIAMDPRLGGEGIATAAQVLGAIELLLFVFYILAALAGGQS